jgi:hypothetical protein
LPAGSVLDSFAAFMRSAPLFFAVALLLPVTASAQEELDRPAKSSKDAGDKGKAADKAADKGGADQAKPSEVQASPGPGAQGRFIIRRGFFAEADLGMFLTFNGRNPKDMMIPKRFSSNIEPQLGVNIGYDVAHNDSFNLAIGARFAMGFNSGLARVSDQEAATANDPNAPKAGQPDPTTKSSDYTVSEVGALVAASIMMNERVALIIRGDIGLAVLDPDPNKAASTLDVPCPTTMGALGTNGCPLPGAGGAEFTWQWGIGFGGEYYTLLNDFSVGLLLRFQGIMSTGGLIPAATITIPVKYTF